jgi:hypothetical protein
VYPNIAAFIVHLTTVGHSNHLSRQNLLQQHQHIKLLMQSKTKTPHFGFLTLQWNRKFVKKLLYIMLVTANAMQIGTNTRHCNTKRPFLASVH